MSLKEMSENKMQQYMQKIGRSLMLPVATLPIAALFMGIGYWIDPSVLSSGTDVNVIAAFLIKAGAAILDNLGLLFAVGLALGMSKDKSGAAAMSGLVAFLIPMSVLSTSSVALFQGTSVDAVNIAFAAINFKNVFIGILAGIVAAEMYNKFSNVKLPMALAFFSGQRLVPIVSAAVMLCLSILLLYIWPPIYDGLVQFGQFIAGFGPVGAGIYGLSNRLLIPTGLHHALNNVFWFNIAGIDDIGKFWASEGTKGVTGMYQAGFFPVMMFGLPAGALAIYQSAKPEHKKTTGSLMLAAAFAAFFTGVTEPLEFSFMFVAWPLYVVHAILTGLSMFVAAFFHWTAGFNFSAGLIDFVLSLRVPIANQPYMLLVQGLVFAVIYYFVFLFVIKQFNLKTPGREDKSDDVAEEIAAASGDERYMLLADEIYEGLGGRDNVDVIDNCTTRLRLQVKDTSKVDQSKIKATGVPGVNVIDGTNIQVVVGTDVQFVADEMARIHSGAPVTKQPKKSTPKDTKKTTPKYDGPKTTDIYAVVTGKFLALTKVKDDVFSSKMMGDGFAIVPSGKVVSTPVEGEIVTVFPTKHAYGIKTPSGAEVLVHIGMDTVELDGKPFTAHVKVGDKVTKGTKLATVDFKAIKEAKKATDVIVVFTNMAAIEKLKITGKGDLKSNEVIGTVTVK